MEARLSSVTLRVGEVARAAWFYREAFALPFEASAATHEAEAVCRGGEPLRLRLTAAGAGEAGGAEIGLTVEDLDAAHERAVAAGARVVRAPGAEAGGRSAAYADADGNLITLGEHPAPLRVAGIDLARGGLAVVVLEERRVVEVFRCDTFAEALLVDARCIGVDVPIGIPEQGARAADEAARRFVGPRAASVFTTPTRALLEAPSYAEARTRALELTGASISAQSYALAERILELERYAGDDGRVIEVHPEVSFRELARRPLLSKHRSDGLAERRALLEQAGIELPASAPRVAEPDLLDATVAAWSAARYARGEALALPPGASARIGVIWR